MAGSDFALGYIDASGKPTVSDRHDVGGSHAVPVVDTEQDYSVIAGTSVDGTVFLEFERKWATCDPFDMALIDGGTTHVLWAIPSGTASTAPGYHTTARGTSAIILSGEGTAQTSPLSLLVILSARSHPLAR